MMRSSTTVMTVKNVLESLAYYRDKLGFDVAFEYGKPTFYVPALASLRRWLVVVILPVVSAAAR